MEPFFSRKFIMAILVLITATVLVTLGTLPVEQWTMFVEIIMGSYMVSNVVGGAIEK